MTQISQVDTLFYQRSRCTTFLLTRGFEALNNSIRRFLYVYLGKLAATTVTLTNIDKKIDGALVDGDIL